MTTPSDDKQESLLAAFEVWAKQDGYDTDRENGKYVNCGTEDAWWAWQAAYAAGQQAAAVRAAQVCEDMEAGANTAHDMLMLRYADAIRREFGIDEKD